MQCSGDFLGTIILSSATPTQRILSFSLIFCNTMCNICNKATTNKTNNGYYLSAFVPFRRVVLPLTIDFSLSHAAVQPIGRMDSNESENTTTTHLSVSVAAVVAAADDE